VKLDSDELARLADQLAPLVAARIQPPSMTGAYTPATLADLLGRSQRAIRAAIARGELQAVKRGRGYLISPDAVAAWATPTQASSRDRARSSSRPQSRSGGPMSRALRSATVGTDHKFASATLARPEARPKGDQSDEHPEAS